MNRNEFDFSFSWTPRGNKFNRDFIGQADLHGGTQIKFSRGLGPHCTNSNKSLDAWMPGSNKAKNKDEYFGIDLILVSIGQGFAWIYTDQIKI